MKLVSQNRDRVEDIENIDVMDPNQKYVIVRTYSAGVFAGYVTEQEIKESRLSRTILMTQARRIFEWEGAASLSQLAQEGTSKPNECKFPCEVDEVLLYEVIEVLSVTPRGQASIASVDIWRE